MEDIKSTTIVPIALYCFILGGYLLYLTLKAFLNNMEMFSNGDLLQWLPWVSCAIFGGGLIVVGRGILQVRPLYWRMLFFGLAICVSSLASLLIAFVIFLLFDVKVLAPYFHDIQTNSVDWFSYLAIFLSEIIVLYYLTKEEVISCFGDMGPLISPF